MKGMRFMNWSDDEYERRRIERAKELYPPETRVKMIQIDLDSPVPAGTKGTVKFVDDRGVVFPTWDNGASLGVAYGKDRFRKLTQKETLEEQQQEDINQEPDINMDMGI